MSDFLNTIGTLHTLEKMGEQGRTIDRQGRALDNMGDALRRSQEDAGMAEAGAAFQRNRANELEALLSKPMAEIAAKNGRFRETYDKQQEMLASWIVSQRAFKELAMKYGAWLARLVKRSMLKAMLLKKLFLMTNPSLATR